MIIYVLPLIIIVLILWFTVTYNRFIALQNLLNAVQAEIDTLLRARRQVLNALITACKQWDDLFPLAQQAMAAIRAEKTPHSDPDSHENSEHTFATTLRTLLGAVVSMPEDKRDGNLLLLQTHLRELEDKVAYLYRRYNSMVNDYNILTGTFPNRLVARLFNYEPEEPLAINLFTQRCSAPRVSAP